MLLTLTHPRLTTTTLAVVPIVVGAAFIFGRRLRRASTGVQDRVAEAMAERGRSVLADSHRAELPSRSRGDAARTARSSRDVVDRRGRARAKIRALFFGVVGFIAFGGVVAVLWEGGQLVLDGALTPGALVSFLLYAITVAAAVGSLASLFGSYQEALGAATRVFELLDVQATVAEPADPTRARASGARRGRARGRELPLLARAARRAAATSTLHIGAGRSRGARRAVGRRQDDDRLAAAALLGRDERPDHARRHRHSRSLIRRPARRDRHGAAGAGAVQRHDPREHRVRAPGDDRPGADRSRDRRRGARRARAASSSSDSRRASTRASASAA